MKLFSEGTLLGTAPAAGGPEITRQVLERLFARHGLGPVRQVAAVAGGQINQVLEVNGEYVVRFRPPGKDGGAFATEQRLFERLRGRVPVPEVVLLDTSREAAPLDCAVARKLPGESLARAWLASGDRQRRWLITQLGEAMRALHEERFPACGGFSAGELVPKASWDAYFQERFERRLGRARSFPQADRALLEAIEGYWRCHRGARFDRPPCLVHRDLHFGNVLVAENRLTGLLDLEAAVAAPCDYELDQLLRFLRYPALFVEPALAARVSPGQFAGAWRGLRDCYPELFQVREMAARLSLYSLEYDLAALVDCYAGRWNAEALRHVTGRMRAALEERLLPAE
jgi:aminoglycoside phosphotransferase (APT) family kinase protein